ncbi:hypothetical protein AABM38_20145 [Heyndrickxia sp. MSNUG]|uniref:hypothetical protein n=1 Tax=Heyndrickxia sp. MSNUG TaxID=3136677 RepID=UPI003C2BE5C2
MASDVPIRVIGTMGGRNHGIGCSNKGHWNNGGIEIMASDVPIRVIGTIESEKPRHRMFQ